MLDLFGSQSYVIIITDVKVFYRIPIFTKALLGKAVLGKLFLGITKD